MDLKNHTPYPAYLFRTVLDAHRSLATLVVRVTFDLSEQGLTPSKDQVWKVSPEPWDSPGGPMEPDTVFRKQGVDLHVFGTARAPGDKAVPSFEIALTVGEQVRRRTIRGPRTWVEQGGDLAASPPVPLTRLPLHMEHAFGGKAEHDGLSVVFLDNPHGKGFYLEKEQATGAPLPQIEGPEPGIRKWTDHPPPAGLGFCAFPSAQRLQEAVVVEDGKITEVKHRLFNMAYPDMILDSVLPGTRVSLSGCTPDAPIVFQVPSLLLGARIELGKLVAERPLAIDQIGIEPDLRRVFVGYRRQLRYRLHEKELRRITLFEGPCAADAKAGPEGERSEAPCTA